MPAPLSLRIKERYMAKRSGGLSQQIAADAVGISVRSAQRIDRGELQPQNQQQRGQIGPAGSGNGVDQRRAETLGGARADNDDRGGSEQSLDRCRFRLAFSSVHRCSGPIRGVDVERDCNQPVLEARGHLEPGLGEDLQHILFGRLGQRPGGQLRDVRHRPDL